MSDHRLIRRIDGKTGKPEWHTLHEWNIINGYEKSDKIIPIVEGEIVEEIPSQVIEDERIKALAKMARYFAMLPRQKEKPAKPKRIRDYSDDTPTSATMYERDC